MWDSRDDCCQSVTLEYRYVRTTVDEYNQFVNEMRHFLFDANGKLIREITSNTNDPQKIDITGLAVGKYTVLTVGNSGKGEKSLIAPLSEGTSISDVQLKIQEAATGQIVANGDELFWNYQEVEVVAGASNHYICDLANIHCHLFFEVSWESVPPMDGTYKVKLTNLTKYYDLNPTLSDLSIPINSNGSIVHQFPHHSSETTTTIFEDRVFRHKVTGEIITLRYKNDRIPVLQVIAPNGDLLTAELDLARAFKEWAWYPDRRAEQIYRIQIIINEDGSAIVRPWATGSVVDWQPGGNVFQ